MNMKKLITAILIILSIFLTFNSVCANDAFSVDFTEDASCITVSGTNPGGGASDVAIVILNPGVTYSQYCALTGSAKALAVKDIRQIVSDENGNYSDTFGFSGESGVYTVIVSHSEGTYASEFKYPPVNDNPIDAYTTTEYAPWMIQYNFTTEAQYNSGYHGGEGGQKGFSMAYSPIDADIIFFGTDTSGIWKSVDGGSDWRISSSGLGCFGTVNIFCSKTDVNTVYAAVCPNSTDNHTKITDATGIYASYDGGASWTLEQQTGYYRHHSETLFAYLGDTLYAASHDGKLYKNISKGSWELVYEYDGTVYNLYTAGDKLILSTSANGILVSSDSGATWTEKNSSLDSSSVLSVAIDPTDENNWFCVTANYLYRSTDAGTTWSQLKTCSQIQSSLSNAFGQVFFGGGSSPRLYVQLYSISYPLRYSDDYGSTFSKMTMDTSLGFMSNKTGYGCEPVRVNPNNPNELIASMDGEIYKSIDGGASFQASSSGYSGLRVMDIAFNPEDDKDIIFSVMDFGAVHSFDSGLGEEYPLTKYKALRYNGKGASRSVARDPFDSEHILINVGQSSTGFIVMESTDGGDTYTVIDATMDYDTTLIFFNQDKEDVIYAKDIISYDGGKSWIKSDYKIYAVSPVNGNIVYGVADNKIYKSSDMGKTWSALYNISAGFQEITADSVVEDKLYVGFYSGGMRIYENGGYTTVNRSTDGYSMNYIYSIAQDPVNSSHLIAGGVNNSALAPTEGIFESYDGGETWYIVKGLPFGRDIWRVRFHPNLSRAYISTSSGTYIYNFNSYVNSDVVITDYTGEVINGEEYFSFNLHNVSDEYKPAAVISASYNVDDGSLDTVKVSKLSLSPRSMVTKVIGLEQTAGKMNRIFVWKDLNTLIPYPFID